MGKVIEVIVLIFKANVSFDKVPYIQKLLERVQVIELLLRLSRDKHFISTRQYAGAIDITDQIGKQATGWKKHQNAASPAVELSGQLILCD
ncbi:MAG: four helix bundle protein [Pseudomonadota bacterium]